MSNTSSSRARSTADPRSGGKIVKQRRTFSSVRKTPYARPTPSIPPPTQNPNPNWLTGLLFPATRKIATQLLSSIFSTDTFSSSSSSSSSGTDSCSEDDIDSDYNGYDMPSDGVAGLKKNETSSEMIKCSEEDPQLTKRKSSTKQLIEQLLLQETYSREECDRLIKIISSRVVDFSTRTEGVDAGLDTPDLCNKALAEAKRWLEEKKVGSSPKSDLDHQTCAFNSVVLPHVTEGEAGSPVDMAKSYMQRRPPWASPRHMESRTPSSMVIELFDEGTPYSVSNSSSLAQKEDSFAAAGSWNIREEIRRVRSKATENMLRTLPSAKNDLSSCFLEPKTTQNSFMADKAIGGVGNKIDDSNSLASVKPIDESLTFAEGVRPHGFPGHSALETAHDGTHYEALSSEPAMVASEPKQESQSIQIVEEGGAVSKSRHSISPELSPYTDPRSSDGNTSTAKEVAGFNGTPNVESNGLPSPRSSSSAGMDIEENPKASNAENPNPASSGHDKTTINLPIMEENCELLSEASMEVPDVNKTNSSIASPAAPQEELISEEDLTTTTMVVVNVEEQTSVVGGTKSKRTTVVEKQEGKKPAGRSTRRGNRGRGK
ncbi:hypothetical protein LguiA_036695 [Lonicera macranthoides]